MTTEEARCTCDELGKPRGFPTYHNTKCAKFEPYTIADGLLAEGRKRVERVALDAVDELDRARVKHPPMKSPHEGYAVILEELDELWTEVKKGGSVPRDPAAMRKEAIEVAAMALRFVVDVCDAGEG